MSKPETQSKSQSEVKTFKLTNVVKDTDQESEAGAPGEYASLVKLFSKTVGLHIAKLFVFCFSLYLTLYVFIHVWAFYNP